MSDRETFQDLAGNENPQFLEDGKRIYLEMKKKYPKNTTEDLENILNGLIASLVCLVSDNVDKLSHKTFLELILKILNKNL